jgi:hypothetical protein
MDDDRTLERALQRLDIINENIRALHAAIDGTRVRAISIEYNVKQIHNLVYVTLPFGLLVGFLAFVASRWLGF